MVPLLLLLLLHQSLADQVCLNISNAVININITGAKITDYHGYVRCNTPELDCIFQCPFSNATRFDVSSVCFEATVIEEPGRTVDQMGQNLICTLHKCKNDSIVPLIESLDSKSSKQEEMMQLFYIRHSCAALFSTDLDVKILFLNVEEQIIHNIMETSQFENKNYVNYDLKDLSLNVFKISEAELSSTEINSRIQIKAPQLMPENTTFVPEIWLPVYALKNIPKEKRIIGVVSYKEHSQFQFEGENISSMVIRIEELGEKQLQNLKTTVKMVFRTFPDTYVDNNSTLQCHYFTTHESEFWKQDGCETYQDDQSDIICDCNHATPFAVLLIREPISEVHWKILSHISYIGCGLSAFFTALSMVIYVFSRNHKMDYSISIHVSLSGALFLLNTAFLLTEWGATVKPDWVCVFVAAVMHYSLLCCFTWMAIEALHLYLLLIKVFNTYYKHYLIKLSLVGWGIPGIIVAVSLGVKDFKQFYGVKQMIMANSNQTSSICWITDDSYFYSLNLVYFTLIFIFNSGILVTVATSICKMRRIFSKPKLKAEAEGKTLKDTERLNASCRSGLTVLGLTCLMGTTWGLAFLGSGYVNYPILYLFCILNSLQGFFIFLWICLSAKKQLRRDMEDRMTLTPVRTSGIKSE